MNKFITMLCITSNILLLIFSYVAVDDIYFRLSKWGRHWESNIFILCLFIAPIASLSLIYLAIKENWLDYIKVTLLRRKLEGKRAVLEEQDRISKLENH